MQNIHTATCPFCNRTWQTTKTGLGLHIKYCKCNPNRSIAPKPHITDEMRHKLSIALKKAHAEGRASTWKHRYKCEHSYPENWFISVINNEFEDKDYICELNVGKWFLDFAWPKKMRYIEIDGSQHERYAERKKSDLEKDAFCKSIGWSVLRLSWSYIYNNKKDAIQIAKDFIDNGTVTNIQWISPREKKQKKILENKIKKQKELEIRKELVYNSGIDFTKEGWITKVSNLFGISSQVTGRWIKRNMPDLWSTSKHR